jgi:hypothetical protein
MADCVNCPCPPLEVASFALYLDDGLSAGAIGTPPAITFGWIYILTLTAPAIGDIRGTVTLPNGDKLPFVVPSGRTFAQAEFPASADFNRAEGYSITIEDVCGNVQVFQVPAYVDLTVCKLVASPDADQFDYPFNIFTNTLQPTFNVGIDAGECLVIPGFGQVGGTDMFVFEQISDMFITNIDVQPPEAIDQLFPVGVNIKPVVGGVTVTFTNDCVEQTFDGNLEGAPTYDRPVVPLCNSPVCGGLFQIGPRYNVIGINVPNPTNLTLSLCPADGGSASFPSALYLYDVGGFNPLSPCTNYLVGCEAFCGSASKVSINNLPAGLYYAVVAVAGLAGENAPFTLAARICPNNNCCDMNPRSLVPPPPYVQAFGQAGTVFIVSGDDADFAVNLPFTFNLCGVNYTNCRVSTNGYIGFPNTTTRGLGNEVLPTVYAGAALYPWWDDLESTPLVAPGSGVYSRVDGVAPNRVFTVEWYRTGHFQDTANQFVTFQVKLFETSNKIQYCYQDVFFGGTQAALDRGASATVGMEGVLATPRVFGQFSFDMAVLQNGMCIEFTPACGL